MLYKQSRFRADYSTEYTILDLLDQINSLFIKKEYFVEIFKDLPNLHSFIVLYSR